MADASIFADKYPKTSGKTPDSAYQVHIHSDTEDGPIDVVGYLPEEFQFDANSQYEATFAQGLNGLNQSLGNIAKALGVNLTTQAMTAQVWQGSNEVTFNISIVFQAETDSYKDVIKPIKDLLKLTMPKDKARGGLLEAPGPHVDIEKLRTAINGVMPAPTPTPQAATGDTSASSQVGVTGVTGGLIDTVTGALRGLGNVPGTINRALDGLKTDPVGFAANAALSGTLAVKNTANAGLVSLSRLLVNSIVNNISLSIGNFFYFPSIVITEVNQSYKSLFGPDYNPQQATVQVTFKTFYVPTQNDLEVMFIAGGSNPNVTPQAAPSKVADGGTVTDYI